MIFIACPVANTFVPTLRAFSLPNGRAIFECLEGIEADVRTEHATFADALRQVAQRMDADAAWYGSRIDYKLQGD